LLEFIKKSKKKLILGNLDAKRDWGHAKDYVYAQWLMLQQEKPKDYVIASGETHSVRDFVIAAFKEVGITIEWQGEGIEEKGVNANTGEILVEVSEKYFRPAEVEVLLGNPSLAEKALGWKRSVNFHDLVAEMVKFDLDQLN